MDRHRLVTVRTLTTNNSKGKKAYLRLAYYKRLEYKYLEGAPVDPLIGSDLHVQAIIPNK